MLTGMLVIFWHKFFKDTICNSFLFNSKQIFHILKSIFLLYDSHYLVFDTGK